jgi:NADPH-dependent curcumin reductase
VCLRSIDPTHRIWMSDKAQYMDCVKIGEVMRAVTVGVVEESKNADFPVGCHVLGFGGCCDYYVGIPSVNVMYKAGECGGLPLTADLSICSIIIGLTAWHGVNKVSYFQQDALTCSTLY